MKNLFKGHLKKEYVMKIDMKDVPKMQDKNGLRYSKISEENMHDFLKQDFIHPSLFHKGRWIGAYCDDKPAAFANVVLQGEKGDYFDVERSSLYLSKLYTFPEYRNKGVMKEVMAHCVHEFCAGGIIALCVRVDNAAALQCYTQFGFQVTDIVHFVRVIRDYVFPRHKI